MTDGFGLGCCFQWYMAGYVSSLLVQHSFCDTQQSAWRDVLLGSSLIRTTPPSVENTKVSLFAWCLLWYSFVAMSSTNMMCVWHRMQPFWLLTCLVLPFDCHVGLSLSNTTDSTLLVCLMTDGFGLGYCFQWYMAGYPNSLLAVPSFCDNQQSAWRDVPLEGLHTGTTPALMQYTKVSYYAWFSLWYLVIVASCTKKMCVWKSHGLFTLLTWLVRPFDCNVGVQLSHLTNSTLLVGILTDAWIMLGGAISNDIPWDTHLSSLLQCTPACFVIHNNPPGGVGFMHWVHSSINEEYQGKLLWMVLAMRYIHG
jgi:hypothetical protein